MSALFDVRATEPHEYRAAADTMRAALLTGPTNDDDHARALPSWEQSMSISAWEGQRCVGHAGAVRVDTVVPGGARLRTAGVTRVGVLPTHTRNGLLSRMMRRLLDDARDERAALASLRASETPIYGRFGFGLAGDSITATLDPIRTRPLRNTAGGSFRLLGIDEFFDVIPALYAGLPMRAGAITRPEHMWHRYYSGFLDGTKGQFVVVHSSPAGVDDGFAHYQLAWNEAEGSHGGKGEVFDVFADSNETELAVWDFLTGIDLVRTWHLESRPVDDLLSFTTHDLRAYWVTSRWDEQWLRLLDVEAALRARTYRSDTTVVIGVTDAMYPDNTGTYLISADGVERSTTNAENTADLTVDVATLSATYMGATTWQSLAAAGRVTGSSDAIDRADLLFGHRPGSWCGSFF